MTSLEILLVVFLIWALASSFYWKYQYDRSQKELRDSRVKEKFWYIEAKELLQIAKSLEGYTSRYEKILDRYLTRSKELLVKVPEISKEIH